MRGNREREVEQQAQDEKAERKNKERKRGERTETKVVTWETERLPLLN